LDYVQLELLHGELVGELVRFLSVLKPGIIFGNIVTVCGGFFLGSGQHFQWILFLFTLVGMALIVGSGCVFNNVIDKDIDHLMKRTCDRVLVRGLLSSKVALLYGAFLGVLGFLVLFFAVNILTVLIAAIGWLFYVVVYSLFLKRKSTWGTTLGAISGAVPPVAGYCAVSGRFDLAAALLFLILFFWQMPHFYAIAIYRLKDFKAANIPVLPAVRSMLYTKIEMIFYVVAYFITTLLLTYFVCYN
jgi:protoheme IX farnesyltransferase